MYFIFTVNLKMFETDYYNRIKEITVYNQNIYINLKNKPVKIVKAKNCFI